MRPWLALALALALAGACARAPRGVPPPAGPSSFAAAGAPRAGRVSSQDGLPIAYTLAGAGSPTLLFVHGWAGDRAFWDRQMRTFAPAHRVVAIDLPGHGESGAQRRDWSVAAFGADVARVMEELGLQEVVLVGHSLGGGVALAAAALAPERVVAVVGVDTLQDVEGRMPGFDGLLASMEQDFTGTCRAFVGSVFGAGADPAIVDSVQDRMCDAPPAIALPVLRAAGSFEAAPALRAVQVPVRCIQGDRFPTRLEANRRHHADFDVIVLPGTGHFPQIEDPEAFDRALGEVLSSLGLR